MSTNSKSLTLFLGFVLLSSSVGCGKGFRTSSGASSPLSSVQSVNINDQLQKAADASQQAQMAISDANAAIASITDSKGNVNLSLFQSSATTSVTAGSAAQTNTQGLLQPLVDKLNTVFNNLFAKVDLVKSQFTAARTALSLALVKLSAADPTQAAEIQQINSQLASIDAMEAQFQAAMHTLAGKLNLASNALDGLVNTATSFIPIPGLGTVAGILIDMFVIDDVKNLITSVSTRLLAV